MSKCVYAHNLQDYRRKPDHYSYQPIVFLCLYSLALIGKQRNIFMSIIVDVNLVQPVTCAMDGKSNNIIHHTIKPSNVKHQDAKKDVAQTIIHKNRRESSKQKLSIISSVMYPRIGLLRAFLRRVIINKDLSLNPSKRQTL